MNDWFLASCDWKVIFLSFLEEFHLVRSENILIDKVWRKLSLETKYSAKFMLYTICYCLNIFKQFLLFNQKFPNTYFINSTDTCVGTTKYFLPAHF